MRRHAARWQFHAQREFVFVVSTDRFRQPQCKRHPAARFHDPAGQHAPVQDVQAQLVQGAPAAPARGRRHGHGHLHLGESVQLGHDPANLDHFGRGQVEHDGCAQLDRAPRWPCPIRGSRVLPIRRQFGDPDDPVIDPALHRARVAVKCACDALDPLLVQPHAHAAFEPEGGTCRQLQVVGQALDQRQQLVSDLAPDLRRAVARCHPGRPPQRGSDSRFDVRRLDTPALAQQL